MRAQTAAAEVAGRPAEQVIVNNQLIGGAFGRRLEVDFISRAVAIAAVDYPIKLTRTREEDTTTCTARTTSTVSLPRWMPKVACGLAPHHRRRLGAGPFRARGGAGERPRRRCGGSRHASDLRNAEPAGELRAGTTRALQQSWWRGVGPLRSTYMLESFIDEVARSVEQDRSTTAWPCSAAIPVPRAFCVWRRKRPAGANRSRPARSRRGRAGGVWQLSRHRGRAAGQRGQGHQAQATGGGHRLRAGDEPGIGQIADRGRHPVRSVGRAVQRNHRARGRVEQTNFHDYRQLRISDAPPVETYIVESREAPRRSRRGRHGDDRPSAGQRAWRPPTARASAACRWRAPATT